MFAIVQPTKSLEWESTSHTVSSIVKSADKSSLISKETLISGNPIKISLSNDKSLGIVIGISNFYFPTDY